MLSYINYALLGIVIIMYCLIFCVQNEEQKKRIPPIICQSQTQRDRDEQHSQKKNKQIKEESTSNSEQIN
jgi:hypothetical protein